MRLRKKPWVRDEIFQYTHYSVEDPTQYKGKWHESFGNKNPIHIEVGTGRGKFMATLAKQNPHLNYIAMEQKQEVLVQAVRKAVNLKLTNMKFILGNVNHLLDYFAKGEISRIYVNFVDPWPKKRHAKRRLTHHRYLKMYQQILLDGADIHFKTDNEILFEFSLNELSVHSFHLKNISLNLYRDQEEIQNHVQTEYEEKFMNEGKPIYRLEARWVGSR